MSEESDLQRLAVALGMASFQAQAHEYSMVSLYAATFVQENGFRDSKIRDIMDSRYNNTLGKLIKDAIKKLSIPTPLASELENALKERNWVTHHFFREYGAVGMSPKLLSEATLRLEKLWPYFEKTAFEVNDLVIDRQVSNGMSKTQLYENIDIALGKYIREVEDT